MFCEILTFQWWSVACLLFGQAEEMDKWISVVTQKVTALTVRRRASIDFIFVSLFNFLRILWDFAPCTAKYLEYREKTTLLRL